MTQEIKIKNIVENFMHNARECWDDPDYSVDENGIERACKFAVMNTVNENEALHARIKELEEEQILGVRWQPNDNAFLYNPKTHIKYGYEDHFIIFPKPKELNNG